MKKLRAKNRVLFNHFEDGVLTEQELVRVNGGAFMVAGIVVRGAAICNFVLKSAAAGAIGAAAADAYQHAKSFLKRRF